MSTVFLSFSNQDRGFAQPLRHALTSLGHKVWSFDEQVAPGDRWQDAIFDRLKEVDAVAVIVSEASSTSGWIHHELGAAVAYARERGRPVIIPIVLGDVQLPANLAQFQGIFVRGDSADDVALKIAEGLERISGIELAKEEKRKEVSKHVESSAADFIQKSLEELRGRERTYQRWAYIWYGLAYVTLLATVAFGVWRVLVKGPSTTDWPALVELMVTGVVVVGLLIALAKYAFSLGKSFMVEALRNADRRHAISFGEFYLRAHGSAVDWTEVKDAFQHWNIDKGSQFIGQQATDLDPQIFAMAVEVAKAVLSREKGK
ncbi:toll/interleukin-1 receptor domain-containing protein [Undibacterium sp. FT79W]|uniref:toll/interleukin-1 receptor domain-containing protein n=1 Tax=Undibacterium sp. FT79W TaxID=2762296 RepID=UPI00164B9F29|nr:toll/interleukin-1 receptor domain-containing protein [Undibacterium sp. FT79W]MBC3878627.1 toll/interleukin-1 receptor domain-containing protein [Undibacterium sp. FT79W]